MKLSRVVSHQLVLQLLVNNSEKFVEGVLSLTPARLKVIASGDGCLTAKQLEQITSLTGKSWMRWVVDGTAHLAATDEARSVVTATYKLLHRTDPVPRSAQKKQSTGRRVPI